MNEKDYRANVDRMRESAHQQDDWALILKVELLIALRDIAKTLRDIQGNMPEP